MATGTTNAKRKWGGGTASYIDLLQDGSTVVPAYNATALKAGYFTLPKKGWYILNVCLTIVVLQDSLGISIKSPVYALNHRNNSSLSFSIAFHCTSKNQEVPITVTTSGEASAISSHTTYTSSYLLEAE